MYRKTGLISFGLLLILLFAMAIATWYEHLHGSAKTGFYFYNNVWFTLLWVLAVTMSSYYIALKSLHKRISVFLLHLSFIVILSGALATRLTGKTGHVHLRENNKVELFIDDWTRSLVVFPFSLSLKSFEVEYYPGANTPANYISVVEINVHKTGERFESTISMNNILRYKGFRFYQSSFDEDRLGSILSVNRDLIGIPITYTGYYLLFIAMLMVLFDRKERFRLLIEKLSKKNALIVFLLLTPLIAETTPTAAAPVVNHEEASRLGSLWIDYHGRISPLQTLAKDFTAKITGKNRYKEFSGEQFFFNMLFFHDEWRQEPVFKINSKELRGLIGINSNYASLSDFIDASGRNKLEPYYNLMYGSNRTKGWLGEAVKLNDKFYLIETLQNGSLLKIFPMIREDGKLQWYSPDTDMPPQTDSTVNVFFRHFFPFYFDAMQKGDATATKEYIETLVALQQKIVGDKLPSNIRLRAELLYNRLEIFSKLFKICLVIGSICLLFFTLGNKLPLPNAKIYKIFYITLWVVFIIASFGIALRTCIGGRFPWSNTYETLLLMSWLSLLTGIIMRRFSFLTIVFSFLLAGFALLVAHIGAMNPYITPLVPVLVSPLLSIHVLTIMIAYGLCGFMTLNSFTAFILLPLGNKKKDEIIRLKETNELLMYPATFLMGAGIFIGAIWANVSWGRYWGWDPKEVWALITFMLMGITFHGTTIRWLKKPVVYHIFIVIIFISALMTYFGVNYLLGGRHSYAG